MKSSTHIDRYKCQPKHLSKISKVRFPLYFEIVELSTVSAFSKLRELFTNVQSTANSLNIQNVTVHAEEPDQASEKITNFKIQREDGIKTKCRISLEIQITAEMESITGFWDKGLALTEIIDTLDIFCEQNSKEKGNFIYLDRSQIENILPKEHTSQVDSQK